MNETIAKQWLPELHAPAVAPVSAPHMRVVQIDDRSFGYRSIVPKSGSAGGAIPGAPQLAAARATQGNVARLTKTIAELGSRYGGTGGTGGPDMLVILPKDLEDALAAQPGAIPANVGTANFNNLRGLDAYKNTGALLIVSRPLPPPRGVEDEAEIIFRPGITRLAPDALYPKCPAHLTTTGGAQHAIGGGGRTTTPTHAPRPCDGRTARRS